MNTRSQRKLFDLALNLMMFALLYLLHYSFGGALRIAHATPILLLPALCAFAMFHDELTAALTGLGVGVFMDAIDLGFCFNALVLLSISLVTSLIARYVFNRNLKAGIVLSILGSLFYFLLRWIVFHAFGTTVSSSLTYLLDYAIPSAVYSAVFFAAFYYWQRLLQKKKGA